jgi:hypothetical protein
MASKNSYIKYYHKRSIIPKELNSDNALDNGKEDKVNKFVGKS